MSDPRDRLVRALVEFDRAHKALRLARQEFGAALAAAGPLADLLPPDPQKPEVS